MIHRMIRFSFLVVIVALLAPIQLARGETITVATYNIEHFADHFLGHQMTERATTKPTDPKLLEAWKEIADVMKRENDEDNWEVAQVVLDAKFNPDILVIEEGCEQKDLEYFNKRWLQDAYPTAIQFPTNTTRNQHLDMLLKPGFKVLQRNDKYYLEPDTVPNERGERLFARGPAFCLIQSPSGFKFWVGVTHQKSKSGNSVDVTKWRLREAKRTHAIMKGLETTTGTSEVVLLGDMNDELGMQEFEQEAGGDAIATLVGPSDDGFVLATKPLVDAGKISFGGYWNTRYRSFIDHVIVSKELSGKVAEVNVVQNPMATVASDHYPVYIKINTDGAATSTTPATPASQPAK